MGFFSDLLGGGNFPTGPTPQETLEETREYWDQYSQFIEDAKGAHEKRMQDLDVQVAFGRLPAEAAENLRQEFIEDYRLELDTIKNGPTANILAEEYEFQRGIAEQKHQQDVALYNQQYQTIDGKAYTRNVHEGDESSDDLTPTGGYRLVSSGEEDIYEPIFEDPSGAPITNPDPPQFEFADGFESFYRQEFGDPQVQPYNRGQQSSANVSRLSSARRASGGGGGSAIGVGRIYSIY